MTALVTRHLPLVADAPDGIKKLRALILELAVRGKLVPQDAMDGFANSHLEEAEYSGKQIHFDGPFCLPKTWKWVRLGDTLDMVNGRAFKSTEWISSGLPIVRIQNLNRPDAEFNFCDEVTVASRHVIDTGTLLISWSGTPGTSFGAFIWNRGRAALNQHIFSCIQKRASFFDRFLQVAINTRLEELIAKAHGGVGLQHVTKGKLEALTLALPPLKEQHRIVAKVDELMALCDRLEADQADAEAAHAQLVQALLGSLTQATDAADFRASWQRLSEHFHTLFTTEASIDALKQTVLQLAIKGALTRQLDTDVPASKLLEDLAADTANYCFAQKAPQPAVTPVAERDKLFAIPNGWRWARLQSLFRVITDGDHQAPPRAESGVAFLTIGNVTSGRLEFNGCREVESSYFADLAAYRKPASGDLLYTVVGATYGRPVLVDTNRPFCVQRHIAILKRSDLLVARFGLYLLGSPLVYDQATSCVTGTAQPTVPLKPLRNILVPLPPLAEQHRIVTKVDELMAMCDQLKTQLAAARQQHTQLATALVEQAVAA